MSALVPIAVVVLVVGVAMFFTWQSMVYDRFNKTAAFVLFGLLMLSLSTEHAACLP